MNVKNKCLNIYIYRIVSESSNVNSSLKMLKSARHQIACAKWTDALKQKSAQTSMLKARRYRIQVFLHRPKLAWRRGFGPEDRRCSANLLPSFCAWPPTSSSSSLLSTPPSRRRSRQRSRSSPCWSSIAPSTWSGLPHSFCTISFIYQKWSADLINIINYI